MRTNCLVCGVSFDAPEGDEYPVCPDCTQTQDDPYDDPFDDEEEIVEEMQERVRHIELPLNQIDDLVNLGVLQPIGDHGYQVRLEALDELQAILQGDRNYG